MSDPMSMQYLSCRDCVQESMARFQSGRGANTLYGRVIVRCADGQDELCSQHRRQRLSTKADDGALVDGREAR